MILQEAKCSWSWFFYYPSDFFFEIIVVDLIFLNLFKWHLMFYGTGINLLNQVNSQDTII